MEAASVTAPAALLAPRGSRLLRLRSDDQLVSLFRLGNDEAFRVIHDRYRTRLLAYTRQMLLGSHADAEDALQDVFLRAYGTLRADDRPVTLRAWLYRVAHNRCIDHMRRPANQPSTELQDGTVAAVDGDPWASLQHRDDLRRLVADVGRLPDQQRSALLMREMEGLSYTEVADALGVTVPAIKSLLVRARIALVEAREARNTACVEIRADLHAAHDRGVRVSARSRRHLHDCSACAEHRDGLRRLREGLTALGPSPSGWGVLAKLIGLGGAGSGAAATAGGGGGAAVSGLVVAGGGVKVAALVCCAAAVVGGGAISASHELSRLSAPPAAVAPHASLAGSGRDTLPPTLVARRAAGPAAPVAAVADAVASQTAAATATDAHASATDDVGQATSAAGTWSQAPEGTAPEEGAAQDDSTTTASGGALAPTGADDAEPPPGGADDPSTAGSLQYADPFSGAAEVSGSAPDVGSGHDEAGLATLAVPAAGVSGPAMTPAVRPTAFGTGG